MKIKATGLRATLPERSPQGRGRTQKSNDPKSSSKGATVSLSPAAEFVKSMATRTEQTPAIREELVTEVKQQIADGTFSANLDVESMLDSLMADL